MPPDWILPPSYYLDESDPDVVVLRRRGPTPSWLFSVRKERARKASLRPPHRRQGSSPFLKNKEKDG